MKLFQPIVDTMGQLLEPREVAEIVITLYENDKLNYQIIGRKAPVSPQMTYKLLSMVAQSVVQNMSPEVTTITKESPNE